MERHIFAMLAAFAALGACAHRPIQAQSRFRDTHLQIEGSRDAQKCSDLTVRSGGELARATENVTLSKSQAPTLEVHADHHASLHVRGWDRPDYAVEVCKFAAADNRPAADQLLKSIVVSRTGGRLTLTGPDQENRWQTVFFVHTPKDAAVNLESGNAPVEASEVNGKLTVRATNGPLLFERCSGTVDAETVNGPISMNGGAGAVHLRASNGPISLRLAEPSWSGSELEARTENGPLSVVLPAGFRSGLRVETSGHAPISCHADACLNARTEGNRFFPRLLQTGSGDIVRLSTHNGPVSVGNAGGRRARII